MQRLKNKLRFKPETHDDMRQWLITYTIILSYGVFTTMGIVIAKHNPMIVTYVDYVIMPFALATILFLYLFTLTYDQKMNDKLSDEVQQCVELYGKGYSFQKIKEELGLRNINDVKRNITEFCSKRS